MKLNLAFHFPVKIVSGEIPIDDIRQDVIEVVRIRGIPASPNQRSNIGESSWRSRMDLHLFLSRLPFRTKFPTDRIYPIHVLVSRVQAFTDACINALHVKARATIQECWLNELGPGAYNSPHDHFPYHWSGILWIDAEHEPVSDGPAGNVELFSPYASRAFGQEHGSVFVRPVNGCALFFPSGLKHMVHPTTVGKRISLAWNCNVETVQ